MPMATERKREWMREYMRDRRAAAKEGRIYRRPPSPTIRDIKGELIALTARVAQLEADLAATRAARA